MSTLRPAKLLVVTAALCLPVIAAGCSADSAGTSKAGPPTTSRDTHKRDHPLDFNTPRPAGYDDFTLVGNVLKGNPSSFQKTWDQIWTIQDRPGTK